MPNLSKPFIERPKATILLVAGFFALGLLAYFQLPISSLPDVDFPTINVSATMPGASAENMASSIAGPLERALANVPNVTSMTSTSSLSQTDITLQFALERDIDAAAQDVQAAINSASGLPKDLPSPPTYEKVNPSAFSILSLAATSDTMPLPEVYDHVDNVISRALSQFSGVGLVDYHGDQVPAIRVRVNPSALAAHGLDLEDVRTALASATVDRPKGTLDGEKKTVILGSNDQLFKARAYNDQIIAWRNGSPVRIRDIGQAVDAAEQSKTAAWSQASRAIIIDIHKQSGAKVNVPVLVDKIKAALPALEASVPSAIKLTVVSDRTQTIRASVVEVEKTLLITIGLVGLVIFLFLRSTQATLIPAISIPLSLIGTFIFMYAFGYSLDNISLMGLTIAVGFVVDDAIVVMENVMRHLEMGKSRLQAAIDGAGEVGFTLLSMTLSLIAAFLPLLLMGGVIGRVFREFSVTVSVAIILSGAISISQTAVACRLFLRRNQEDSKGRLYRSIERAEKWFLNFYRGGLSWVLRHRRWGMIVTIGMFFGSVYLFVIIPKGFVPEQDNGLISASTEAAPDISFTEMSRKQQELAQIVMRDTDVDNVYHFVEPYPAANNGRLMIFLKAFDKRKTTAREVIARLRPQLKGAVPGVKVFLKPLQEIQIGGGGKTQYQYVVQGSDLAELYKWAQIYEDKLNSLPQLQDVASDLNPSAPSMLVAVDRDKAAKYGISPDSVDQILYDAFGQRQVATIFSPLSQHKVILEVEPSWHLDGSSLQAIRIKSPNTGQQIPLDTIAHLNPSFAPLAINHLGPFPSVTLSFNLAPGAFLSDAVSAIQKLEIDIKKPSSIRASFRGSAQAFQDSLASQPLLIIAAILVVYIILGVLYESFIHPITILSSLPSATFGALLAMWLLHYDLSVITLIGLILLVGIVKKNAIMMVDVALGLQREQKLDAEDAIFKASLLRFRPIMMTTMCALLGAIPLVVSSGAGSELRRPLGVAVIGGLLVSQLVTLYTVPLVFLNMDRLARRPGGRKGRGSQGPPARESYLEEIVTH
jgi:hydrophobe/amphiphile efflux-1 (HAE1) family protein